MYTLIQKTRTRFSVLYIALSFLSISTSAAQNPNSRPILFVHGFCGSFADFGSILNSATNPLIAQLPANEYPSSDVYAVVYNSVHDVAAFYRVNWLPDAQVQLQLWPQKDIPPQTRFFLMIFYDPIGRSIDVTDVAQISVLNKAYELSKVIKLITAVTQRPDVVIVGHSMGGLDARAYVEGLASHGVCYDYYKKIPNYSPDTCTPGVGDGAYANDVADIITIDTPHAGSPLASMSFDRLDGVISPFIHCVVGKSVNKIELEPGSELLKTLANKGTIAGTGAKSNTAPIQAIKDYFRDKLIAWDLLVGFSDDIVPLERQSIVLNLDPSFSSSSLFDTAIAYSTTDNLIQGTPACWLVPLDNSLPILHVLGCLGAQPKFLGRLASQINAYGYSSDVTISGGTLTGTDMGLATNAPIVGYNGVTGQLGTLFFNTGALTSGSIQLGGTFAGGGTVAVHTNGSNGTRRGADFIGVFSGTVSWTLITLFDGTHSYTLTALISEPNGIAGEMVVLTVNTGKGYFNGQADISAGDINFGPP